MEANVKAITAASICNRIRMESSHIADTGFPLDVFPDKVQSIVLDMVRRNNYKVEYLATAMLSAVSATLGATHQVHIRGDWNTNAVLYIILVGRPGLGKTPPLEAAYAPLRKIDEERFEKFKRDMETYKRLSSEKGKDETLDKPILECTIVSDFTPENLMQTHCNNPRSTAILVDEIMGMFKSANRYNNGPLIEQLLTAWSGGAMHITRVGNPMPMHIAHPCINIIGTTQTKLIRQLFRSGYEDNGLTDRFLFVLPKSQRVPAWREDCEAESDVNANATSSTRQWETIIRKVMALDYREGSEDGKRLPHVLDMDKEAKAYFREWWNGKVNAVNSIENDVEVDSRTMKQNSNVARLSLLLQVMRFASGESHLQFVDAKSVKGAVRLVDYFEDCCQRIRAFVASDACDDPTLELLDLLPNSFTRADAVRIGQEALRVSDRTVDSRLTELLKNRLIRRPKQGQYEKVRFGGEKADGTVAGPQSTETKNGETGEKTPFCNE